MEPPKPDFSTYSFIIDDKNNCYFYLLQAPINRESLGGVDNELQFAKLKPKDLLIVPIGHENEFIQQRVLQAVDRSKTKTITIASFKDTITNFIVPYLRKLESDTSKHIYLSIRLAFKEERETLSKK